MAMPGLFQLWLASQKQTPNTMNAPMGPPSGMRAMPTDAMPVDQPSFMPPQAPQMPEQSQQDMLRAQAEGLFGQADTAYNSMYERPSPQAHSPTLAQVALAGLFGALDRRGQAGTQFANGLMQGLQGQDKAASDEYQRQQALDQMRGKAYEGRGNRLLGQIGALDANDTRQRIADATNQSRTEIERMKQEGAGQREQYKASVKALIASQVSQDAKFKATMGQLSKVSPEIRAAFALELQRNGMFKDVDSKILGEAFSEYTPKEDLAVAQTATEGTKQGLNEAKSGLTKAKTQTENATREPKIRKYMADIGLSKARASYLATQEEKTRTMTPVEVAKAYAAIDNYKSMATDREGRRDNQKSAIAASVIKTGMQTLSTQMNTMRQNVKKLQSDLAGTTDERERVRIKEELSQYGQTIKAYRDDYTALETESKKITGGQPQSRSMPPPQISGNGFQQTKSGNRFRKVG